MLCNKLLVVTSLIALLAVSGVFNADIEPRIVNGKPAARGQFPFYALLKIFLGDGRQGYCGGTLINEQWILTAGHCVNMSNITITKFEVHLGALSASKLTETGRVVVSTNRLFVHPNYSIDGIKNDVALLKLNQSVKFSATIKAVKLPTKPLFKVGTRLTAIGFGKRNTSDATISPTLQFAELAFIPRAQCALVFPDMIFRKDVICAKGANKESTCNGDSGGPLVSYDNRRVPTIVGGSSFVTGSGCHHGIPAGFSNTFAFLPWIRQTIADNK